MEPIVMSEATQSGGDTSLVPDEKPKIPRKGKDFSTMEEPQKEKFLDTLEQAGMMREATPEDYVAAKPKEPVVTSGESRGELTIQKPGFVVLTYTVKPGQNIPVQMLQLDTGAPTVFVEKGSLDILSPEGRTLDNLKEGSERLFRKGARFTLAAKGKETAIVRLQYAPSEEENRVLAGFEPMRRHQGRIMSKKITLITTAKAFKADGDGSWAEERRALAAMSSDMVTLEQFENVGKLLTEINRAQARNETIVVQLTDRELKEIEADPAMSGTLMPILEQTRMMVLPSKVNDVDVHEKRVGIPFIREIEEAGVLLGHTTEGDIEKGKETEIARDLARLMSRLIGNKPVTSDMLAALLAVKTPDVSTFSQRVAMLTRELLITMPARAYEADKELHGRRKVLLSV